MSKRIPNLETAIDECKSRNLKFDWKWCNTSHIKFYINGFKGFVHLTSKNDNRDKVRKDIQRHLTA